MDIRVANVGSRIREARQRQDITQAQLADKTNISISHLSAIESGRSNFGVDILMRMTEALGGLGRLAIEYGHPRNRRSARQRTGRTVHGLHVRRDRRHHAHGSSNEERLAQRKRHSGQ